MGKRIIIISNSFFSSGAELSLIQFVDNCNSKLFRIFLVVPKNAAYWIKKTSDLNIRYLPLEWFYFTLNPIRIFQFVRSVIISTIELVRIIEEQEIDIIYSNTTKSHVYCAIVKIFTGKKYIWHIRDNMKSKLLQKILVRQSDNIVCNSKYIYNQILTPENKKQLVYGGINSNDWSPPEIYTETLKKELGLGNDISLITQVGQLTKWKNHFDFIKTAKIITQYTQKVHFLIIGEDLSGREAKYKKELKENIERLSLHHYFSFLGNRQDMKELMSQMDILIHPAINEPFGRVLIEAMAMEKPVVAYNCGGPKEIVTDNKTGYLVEPGDFAGLADKTIHLLQNSELRKQFGKAGRRRVIEKFNIERYVREMEKVFENM
jgi:glycosyltransferase involved in cell wall biosynthesis